MTVSDKISELINPIIVDMGYELVGVEYLNSGKYSVLRVYIDLDDGIKVTDCERVSKQLSSIFDVENPISSQYSLEVSSPGVERPLFNIKHYQRFLGNNIKVKTYRKVDGQRKFVGSIFKVSEVNNSIELATELKVVTIDLDLIDKANLIFDF